MKWTSRFSAFLRWLGQDPRRRYRAWETARERDAVSPKNRLTATGKDAESRLPTTPLTNGAARRRRKRTPAAKRRRRGST